MCGQVSKGLLLRATRLKVPSLVVPPLATLAERIWAAAAPEERLGRPDLSCSRLRCCQLVPNVAALVLFNTQVRRGVYPRGVRERALGRRLQFARLPGPDARADAHPVTVVGSKRARGALSL